MKYTYNSHKSFLKVFLRYIFIEDLREFADVLRHIENVYKSSSQLKHDVKQYQECNKYAHYSQLIVKWVPIVYMIASGAFACGIMFTSWMSGILRPQLNLYLPNILNNGVLYVDTPTLVANAMMHAFAVAIIGCYDATIQLTFCNILMLATIIGCDIDEFQHHLNANGDQLDANEVKRPLLKIIESHEEYKG